MTDLKIGGMSWFKGIEFSGERYSVSIKMSTGKFSVHKNIFYSESGFINFMGKIPFLRAFFFIFMALARGLGQIILNLYKKHKVAFIIAAALLIYIIFAPSQYPPIESVDRGFFWEHYMEFIAYGFMTWFIFAARKHHTIEHKLIGAAEDNGNLSLKNIKRQKKEHRRCGGVLGAWYLIGITLYAFLYGSFPSVLISLSIVSVSYELSLLARKKNWIGSIFFAPGYLIQKLTTTDDVTDADILKARPAIIKLLEKERIPYTL